MDMGNSLNLNFFADGMHVTPDNRPSAAGISQCLKNPSKIYA